MNIMCLLFGCEWERKEIIENLESTNPMELANNRHFKCKRCGKTMNLFD